MVSPFPTPTEVGLPKLLGPAGRDLLLRAAHAGHVTSQGTQASGVILWPCDASLAGSLVASVTVLVAGTVLQHGKLAATLSCLL